MTHHQTYQPAPKRPRWVVPIIVVGSLAVLGIVFAAAITAGGDPVAGQPNAHTADALEVAAPPTTTTEPEPAPLAPGDFAVTLKVTDKQCFGDIGCNVTVEPQLEYVHAADTLENRTFSVTITIAGDETGPIITTIDATGTEYSMMPVALMTRSSGVTPTGKVTDVQEY